MQLVVLEVSFAQCSWSLNAAGGVERKQRSVSATGSLKGTCAQFVPLQSPSLSCKFRINMIGVPILRRSCEGGNDATFLLIEGILRVVHEHYL